MPLQVLHVATGSSTGCVRWVFVVDVYLITIDMLCGNKS